MKISKIVKYFIVCLTMLFVCNCVLADVMPYYSGSISKQTIGFLQVPNEFNVYLYPRSDSQIVDKVSWNKYEAKLKKNTIEPSEMFAVQVPEKAYAYCMVVDELDDWYKIIYDKTHNKSGWIKPEKQDDFWGLRDFYSFYGKQNGLYYMKNIDYRKRGIYSGAYQESQKLGGFTLIKSIKLNKISGNWALVTVVDFDSKPKIGYIRWREDDGTIVLFPKMNAR